MFKLKVLCFFSMFFFLGCTAHQKIADQVVLPISSPGPSSVQPSPSSIPEMTYLVGRGVLNTKWNKIEIRNAPTYFAGDWNSYPFNGSVVTYSLEIPKDWKLNTTVFVDVNNQKVAEFSPGVVDLKNGQSCFDSEYISQTGTSQLVSQKNINFIDYSGVMRVEKVSYEGGKVTRDGYWYPYSYCIVSGDRAFVMTFYSFTEKSSQEDLYRRVISSFRFL